MGICMHVYAYMRHICVCILWAFLKCNPRAVNCKRADKMQIKPCSPNIVSPCFHLILGHPTAAHFPRCRTSHLR